MSICLLNIGQTHSGKTTRTIQIASALNLKKTLVNDIQHESKYRQSSWITKFYGNDKEYTDLIQRVVHTTIILEDAVSYLPHGANNVGITRPIAKKRFSGNAFIINFHALRQVPEYIMDYVDYMYIGKSRGNIKNIEKKFENYPEIIEAWYQVNKSKNPYAFIEVKL